MKPFVAFLTLFLALMTCATAQAQSSSNKAAKPQPVFWTDPGNIASKDLFYGPGGKEGVPKGPFSYVKEDEGGTSPKFKVKDAEGREWTAKLGVESQSECVASRLLWAVGYGANTNYFFADLDVPGAVNEQKRGRDMIRENGHMYHVRLQRKADGFHKKSGWDWRDKRFRGNREFNGLRVMMALLSNWDMKAENNAIMQDKHDPSHIFYEVSDVGATFGKSAKGYSGNSSKNNLLAYKNQKFVGKVSRDYVDLNFPGYPSFIYFVLFEYGFYFSQLRNHWIGRHIPIEDVRWVTSLLGQLSDAQIRDAFRAGGYTPQQVDEFAMALKKRIAELKKI